MSDPARPCDCDTDPLPYTVCPVHGKAGKPSSAVDHPDHFGGEDNPHETIKCLQAWLTPAQFVGFLRGNAIKYLSRAGKKGPAGQDYQKAAWYVARLIELEAK